MHSATMKINPDCNTFFVLGKHLEFTFFSISIKTGHKVVGLECTQVHLSGNFLQLGEVGRDGQNPPIRDLL